MDNQQQQQKNKTAFVLGNGRSRLNLDHTQLKNIGTVYGCNALYREFDPDFLIAVDVKMVNEIVASGYHLEHKVWTNPNKGILDRHNLNLFSPHKGWSSGPTALWFAANNSHKHIYIFGFDYQGVNGKFNNVYSDTFNYKKSMDTPTFFGNWLAQTEKVIKEFRHTQFYRVIEDNSFIPDKLMGGLENFAHISYTDFEKQFEGIYIPKINQKTII